MIVLGYGGGTNGAAILAGWHRYGLQKLQPIDMILFADTGGERPETYEHIALMDFWCDLNGFPPITVVRRVNREGNPITLEGYLRERNQVPPVAYGFKTCSQKYKIQPQDKYLNRHPDARKALAAGETVTKLVGYDFGETRRWMGKPMFDGKYTLRFPLVEWEWTREDCVRAIQKEGLPLPGKSSCFFCPNMKAPEIRALQTEHPLLFQRALDMEDAARPGFTKIKGLGRSKSWREHIPCDDNATECLTCAET